MLLVGAVKLKQEYTLPSCGLSEHQKKLSSRIRSAVFMGVVVSTITLFVHGMFRGYGFVPIDQVPSRIPSSIVWGVIVGMMSYWFVLRSDRRCICPKCGKIKHQDNILQCSCGGHFEKTEEMKWTGK
jgi:hypothetical protein